MFRKQLPQLLRSAAVESVIYGAPVNIPGSKVMDFLNEFLKDETTQDYKVNASGTLLKYNGKKMHMNYYKK